MFCNKGRLFGIGGGPINIIISRSTETIYKPLSETTFNMDWQRH